MQYFDFKTSKCQNFDKTCMRVEGENFINSNGKMSIYNFFMEFNLNTKKAILKTIMTIMWV
jgi:hypothetical protein